MADRFMSIVSATPALQAVTRWLTPKDVVRLAGTCKVLYEQLVAMLTYTQASTEWIIMTAPAHLRIPLISGQSRGQVVKETFIRTCAAGDLVAAKWLISRYNLTRDEVTSRNNYAFRQACWRNQQEVVEWLVTHHKLTREEVMYNNGEIFMVASCYGVNTIKWLIAHYNLTREDIDAPRLMWSACGRVFQDGLELVQMIASHFSITREELRAQRTLQHASSNSLKIVKWLVTHYKLDGADITANDNEAYLNASVRRNEKMKKWLTANSELKWDGAK